MYKSKTILGLIPARGGSKGLPGKNVKPLLGKPLIAWTIEQGRASRYLDRVVVSTDDPKIAAVSRKYGAEVPFMRPAELAQDHSPTSDTILHALDHFSRLGVDYDYLALLEPTSPLRDRHDIDRGIRKMIDNQADANSLVSLGEIALEHPAVAKRIDAAGFVHPFIDKQVHAKRRQDLSKAYFPYGVIYLAKTSALRRTGSFYQERTLSLFIQRWQNYEIDGAWDFVCIEAILKKRKGSGQ